MKLKKILSTSKAEVVIVICISFLALGLRLYALKQNMFMCLDELYSWYFAKQDSIIKTTTKLFEQDVHMPLYFVILHLWIKLFSKSILSMKMCSIMLTIPIVPLAFYFVKDLFNRFSAYLCICFLTISAVMIHYSIWIRFYGLLILFSLLSSYSFVKMLQNFNKKTTLFFVLSNICLIYTFTLAPLLTFCYFAAGLVYAIYKKNIEIKKYLIPFVFITVFSIPMIVFVVHNFIRLSESPVFLGDLYTSNLNTFLNIVAMFLTNDMRELFYFDKWQNFLLASIFDCKTLILVFVPVLICVWALIRGLLTKNEKLYLFLMPAVLFSVFVWGLSACGVITFIERYSVIIFLNYLVAVCFGFSTFKNVKLKFCLCFLWIFLNILIYVTKPVIFHKGNDPENFFVMEKFLEDEIKITNEDTILIPYSGGRVSYFIHSGNIIDFDLDDGLLLNDKKAQEFYFGEKTIRNDILQKINSNAIAPFPIYEQNLVQNYFEKMKKGQRFVIVAWRHKHLLNYFDKYIAWEKSAEKANDGTLFWFLMIKCVKDSIQIATKYFNKMPVSYQSKGFSVFIWEKE